MGMSLAITNWELPRVLPLSLQNGEDIKFTRQLIEALLQRGRYGNASREPLDPLVMALLPGKPDTLDAGQTPGFADCAHRNVDRAERIDPHRENRLAVFVAASGCLMKIHDIGATQPSIMKPSIRLKESRRI
jgi:hypothetical protein